MRLTLLVVGGFAATAVFLVFWFWIAERVAF